MVTRQGVAFQGKRLAGIFRLLFRNRMAAIGLVLLIIFSFMAIASPLLTPYGPYDEVSGRLAQPEWVMNFPDGYYFSKNMVIGTDPSFHSLNGEWQFTSPDGPLASLPIRAMFASNVTTTGDPGGSIQIVNTDTVNRHSLVIGQTVNYPYNGPPKKFIADFHVYTETSNLTQSVHVRTFITRALDGRTFNVWNENDTSVKNWVPAASLLPWDSSQQSDKASVRKVMGALDSPLDPAAIIFAAKTSYTYGIEISLGPGQVAYVDGLDLKLFGTAFGIFGTDYHGVDVWAQLVYGSRISMIVGLTAAGIGIGLGLLVGLMAGFLGKIVDEALMRFTDMMLVIPGLPLLIVLVAVLGASIYNVIIIIGFFGWMGFARIVRSQVLSLRERPFVEAAKASGAGPGRIIFKHIFPNIVSLTYVNLALSVPGAILTEAALAFLGLSDPSVISWGHIFSNVNQSQALAIPPPPWWWVLPPGFAIALVSLSFVLIGYSLDEIFNPKLRQRR